MLQITLQNAKNGNARKGISEILNFNPSPQTSIVKFHAAMFHPDFFDEISQHFDPCDPH